MKFNLWQQEATTEFGLWLRAPSPPRRSERGLGRGGPRKGRSHYDQETIGRSQSSFAREYGQFQVEGGGPAVRGPNPKRSNPQKETREDSSEYNGRGRESFVFNASNENNFQKRSGLGIKGNREQSDRGNFQKGNNTTPFNSSYQARSPTNGFEERLTAGKKYDVAETKEGNQTLRKIWEKLEE
jgi:hypothetical protein